DRRYAYHLTIASGRSLNRCVIAFIVTHFMHYTEEQPVIFRQGHTDREDRQAVQEVGGAVKRIDDPMVLLVIRSFYSTFFRDKTRTRKNSPEAFYQHSLRLFIDIGDEIVEVGFLFNAARVERAAFLQDEFSHLLADPNRLMF